MKNLLILLCLAIAAMSYLPRSRNSSLGAEPHAIPYAGLIVAQPRTAERGAGITAQAPPLTPITIESSAYCIHGKMASGQITFTGAAASNFLPFRSRWFITSGPLKIKEVQILDRHNKRYHKLLDIWIEDCNQATHYGRRQITVERQGEMKWLRDKEYPLLIEPTREMLRQHDVPWIIENVMRAPLGIEIPAVVLCSAALGGPTSRHRRFEVSFPVLVPKCPGHARSGLKRDELATRYRKTAGIVASDGISAYLADGRSIAGHFSNIERARALMEIDWMKRDELAQAIPPRFTEYIGRQLLDQINRGAA